MSCGNESGAMAESRPSGQLEDCFGEGGPRRGNFSNFGGSAGFGERVAEMLWVALGAQRTRVDGGVLLVLMLMLVLYVYGL